MLNALILQSACAGFLFHWVISDTLYWGANPTTQKVMYSLFIINMLGVAYSHIVLSRNKQVNIALNPIDD